MTTKPTTLAITNEAAAVKKFGGLLGEELASPTGAGVGEGEQLHPRLETAVSEAVWNDAFVVASQAETASLTHRWYSHAEVHDDDVPEAA
jgi:hypothetical protein